MGGKHPIWQAWSQLPNQVLGNILEFRLPCSKLKEPTEMASTRLKIQKSLDILRGKMNSMIRTTSQFISVTSLLRNYIHAPQGNLKQHSSKAQNSIVTSQLSRTSCMLLLLCCVGQGLDLDVSKTNVYSFVKLGCAQILYKRVCILNFQIIDLCSSVRIKISRKNICRQLSKVRKEWKDELGQNRK